MNDISDDSLVLDKCKLISDVLRSRYKASGQGLGQLTNSIAHKLPISLVLALRRLAEIRNKVIKDRTGLPVTVYRDKVDRNYFEKLASEIVSYLEADAKTSKVFINHQHGKIVKPLSIKEADEETIASQKTRKNSRSQVKKLIPEASMSNPHYRNDLKVLDGVWDLAQITNSETIFIISGCNIVAELLDRPVAEMLRDKIDCFGNSQSYRRAIIISDFWWWQEAMDKAHPIIAVGGPATNGVTREILEKVEAQENNGLLIASVFEDFPRIAVWGETSIQTKESVEQFIRTDLRAFLNECWK